MAGSSPHLSLLMVGECRAEAQVVLSSLSARGRTAGLAFAEDEAGVVDHLSRGHCDLVIVRRTDPSLPALRLLDLLRTRGSDVPVIVLSDEHTREELVEVIRNGARDCLARSEFDRLGACIEREARDAEARGASESRRMMAEDRYRALVDEIPALIYAAWADEVGSRAYLSPQLQTMTGFTPVEWLSERDAWARHLHPEDKARVLEEYRRSCAEGPQFVSDYRVRRRDGGVAWWQDHGRVVRGTDGRAQFVRGFVLDVTEQKTDALTGLQNREALRVWLSRALAQSGGDASLALLILELDDHFQDVNNVLGHRTGDEILRLVAERLVEVVGERERISRLRGDEFGVLLPGSDLALARHVGDKILGLFERPFMVDKMLVEVGASVGIAAAPEHGEDAELLLRRADLAVQAAQRRGSGCVVYSAECDPYNPERLKLLGELRWAIEAGQLQLYYQPKVDLRTRLVVGVEALLRWRHPRKGIVPPGDFIPAAEEAGVIKPLTWWVLEQAVRQCAAWERSDEGLDVAVNLSARSLHDPQLTPRITELLKAHELAPQRLQLEVTESAVMTDSARAAEILVMLDALGVSVSIDDFGTGNSSLRYLRDLPVSEIKIDKSFVLGMNAGENGRDKAIVRSTSELGHNLGLRVVAEGVEDEAALELLSSYGCDLAQGYYIARPMPAEKLAEWRATSPWGGKAS
ncbi:MAG TPA: EAL domain-containing protein [Vicinamibacteria bacterium]|nr:EAL domain-containing protein [Vicinamibacteria bacterium]